MTYKQAFIILFLFSILSLQREPTSGGVHTQDLPQQTEN